MATVTCHCRLSSSSFPSTQNAVPPPTRLRPPVPPLNASSPLTAAYSTPPNQKETQKETPIDNDDDKKKKRITSVSNPFVKHCVKLRLSSSHRRSVGSVLVVGLTPILEICRYQRDENRSFYIIDQLIILEGTIIPIELTNICVNIVHVSGNVLKKISGMQSVDSTEVIAIMKLPKSYCELDVNGSDDMFEKLLPSPSRLLVLDGIQDPGNFGTLIRSARAFKWDGVFLLPGCCDPFNEKALRSSRGSSFQLPIISGNYHHLNKFTTLQNMKILAGHPANSCSNPMKSSTLLTKSKLVVDRIESESESESLCLVLGSEGNGLSSEVLEMADELVSVPMEGSYESLNVSVAGGILLFMLQNQRRRE